jgi:hypothetical protein
MPGLAAADPNMMPPQPAQQQPVPPDQGQPADPQSQGIYDKLVTKSFELIFDTEKEEVRPEILKSLKGGDPKEALAQTAAQVFHRVEESAAQAGQQIPGDVKESAGKEVFDNLAHIASATGPVDFMNDDNAYQGALYLAADELRQMEQASGLLDPEAAKADFQDLAAADKDGRLAQIMAGL